jgi:sialic acid synthase SpsE
MNNDLKRLGLDAKFPTYVIAEAGINHGGNLNTALDLVRAAARAGADAIKFQTYISEKRAPKNRPDVLDLFKKHELPFAAFGEIKRCADQIGIQFFSTPFDEESVDYLESIGCPLYKIASFDVVNHRLLNRIAATKKTVIMSVGMAKVEEIDAAIKSLSAQGSEVVILHCISSYPTDEKDAVLSNVRALSERFGGIVGQSDHTPDIFVPLLAVAAGARVLEKHLKLDSQQDCIDAAVSLSEQKMRELVLQTRRIEKIMGHPTFGVRSAESGIEIFRRPSK